MGVVSWLAKRLGVGSTVFEIRVGNIILLARHPILAQLAADMARGLTDGYQPSRRFIIYCGTQDRFGWHVLRRGVRIGLQTEQFLDQQGNALWGRNRKIWRRTLSYLKRLDFLLDINETNRPSYETLSAAERGKLISGPYIFPQVAPAMSGHDRDRCVFFGAMTSEHRKRIVPSLAAAGRCDLVEDGVFASSLFEIVSRYRAVLNVHFTDGVYTEYPRLLSALMLGKPIVSEPLSSALTAGTHYVPRDAINSADYDAVYAAFATHMCGTYSFQRLLERLDRQI